ncbi:MAG: tRNA (adenosine(37)-N6)-threonylcarbamoyltransferase complex transferase subunit TsaD [Corallococcus sp.]|nr:tRNA (adenosine(37)-N6)-threonylcarbamoyltransferase complex transferase subunit TsaD [Corallococcus sp.]MCM1358980.1 tRNA (adenosine(37)-N6)-threonylcarbamoyltransferase complex transferase subunit TsaD [Corallococcus sp.]MCM1394969.1 tRNA (adenosine(37)-N6)-threonylcarbamoyltransferase complex transferase subunit TsaD [Corallococcus sp.]
MNEKDNIYTLGIESSCDETAAAVVKNGREILSDVVLSQIDIHKIYGGVVPEIASRNHIKVVDKVVKEALSRAKMTLDDLDAVAVTYGAGLVGALLVGVSFAKGLCQASGLPLIAVNHVEGHICANYLTYPDLKPPYMCLLASGGHTSIVQVEDYDKYTVLRSTVDDAVGEAFDKVARVLGLPYPGGPQIDKLAQNGKAIYPFHSVVVSNGNFSYSGLKTAVINVVHNATQRSEELSKADIAASFNKCAVDGIVDALIEETNKSRLKTVAVAGGVGANSYLRARLAELEQSGFRVCLPKLSLCGDNAAMIASRGYYMYKNGEFADLSLNACPTLKLRGEKPKR